MISPWLQLSTVSRSLIKCRFALWQFLVRMTELNGLYITNRGDKIVERS